MTDLVIESRHGAVAVLQLNAPPSNGISDPLLASPWAVVWNWRCALITGSLLAQRNWACRR